MWQRVSSDKTNTKWSPPRQEAGVSSLWPFNSFKQVGLYNTGQNVAKSLCLLFTPIRPQCNVAPTTENKPINPNSAVSQRVRVSLVIVTFDVCRVTCDKNAHKYFLARSRIQDNRVSYSHGMWNCWFFVAVGIAMLSSAECGREKSFWFSIVLDCQNFFYVSQPYFRAKKSSVDLFFTSLYL